MTALCRHDLIWIDDHGDVCCLDCDQPPRRYISPEDREIMVNAAKRRVELKRAAERKRAYYSSVFYSSGVAA